MCSAENKHREDPSGSNAWGLFASREGDSYRFVRSGRYVVLCTVATRLARRYIPRRPNTPEWRAEVFCVVRLSEISEFWGSREEGQSLTRQQLEESLGELDESRSIRLFRPPGDWDFRYTREEFLWVRDRLTQALEGMSEWTLRCRLRSASEDILHGSFKTREDAMARASRLAADPGQFGFVEPPEKLWIVWLLSEHRSKLEAACASGDEEPGRRHIPSVFAGIPSEEVSKDLGESGWASTNETEFVRRVLKEDPNHEALIPGVSYRLRCPYAETHEGEGPDDPAYLITGDHRYAASIHCSNAGCELKSRSVAEVGSDAFGLSVEWMAGEESGGRSVDDVAEEIDSELEESDERPMRVESERGLELLAAVCRRISAEDSDRAPVVVSTHPEDVMGVLAREGLLVEYLRAPRVSEPKCGKLKSVHSWNNSRYSKPLLERALHRQLVESWDFQIPANKDQQGLGPREQLAQSVREGGPVAVCRNCPLRKKDSEGQTKCSYRRRIERLGTGGVDAFVVLAAHWHHEISIGDFEHVDPDDDGSEEEGSEEEGPEEEGSEVIEIDPVVMTWGRLEEIRSPGITVFGEEARGVEGSGPLGKIPDAMAFGFLGQDTIETQWSWLTVKDVEALCQEGTSPTLSTPGLSGIEQGPDLGEVVERLSAAWVEAEQSEDGLEDGYKQAVAEENREYFRRLVEALRGGELERATELAGEVVTSMEEPEFGWPEPVISGARLPSRWKTSGDSDAGPVARVYITFKALFGRLQLQYVTEHVQEKRGAVRFLWTWALGRVRRTGALPKKDQEGAQQHLYALTYGSLDGGAPDIAITREASCSEFGDEEQRRLAPRFQDSSAFEPTSQILHSFTRGWLKRSVWEKDDSWVDQYVEQSTGPVSELVEVLSHLEDMGEKWGVVTQRDSPLLGILEEKFSSFEAERDSNYFGSAEMEGSLEHLDWVFVIGALKLSERRGFQELVRMRPNLRLARQEDGLDLRYWRRTANGRVAENHYVPPHRGYLASWPESGRSASSTEAAARVDEAELHRAIHSVSPLKGRKRIVLLGLYGTTCRACSTVFVPQLLSKPDTWLAETVENRKNGDKAAFPGQIRVTRGGGRLYRVDSTSNGQTLAPEKVHFIDRLSRFTPLSNQGIAKAVGVNKNTVTDYQRMSPKARKKFLYRELKRQKPEATKARYADLLGVSTATLRRYER